CTRRSDNNNAAAAPFRKHGKGEQGYRSESHLPKVVERCSGLLSHRWNEVTAITEGRQCCGIPVIMVAIPNRRLETCSASRSKSVRSNLWQVFIGTAAATRDKRMWEVTRSAR